MFEKSKYILKTSLPFLFPTRVEAFKAYLFTSFLPTLWSDWHENECVVLVATPWGITFVKKRSSAIVGTGVLDGDTIVVLKISRWRSTPVFCVAKLWVWDRVNHHPLPRMLPLVPPEQLVKVGDTGCYGGCAGVLEDIVVAYVMSCITRPQTNPQRPNSHAFSSERLELESGD